MPSNNLDLYRFIRFVLDVGADEKLAPDIIKKHEAGLEEPEPAANGEAVKAEA